MKKAILLSLLFVACVFTASAQKFALIALTLKMCSPDLFTALIITV